LGSMFMENQHPWSKYRQGIVIIINLISKKLGVNFIESPEPLTMSNGIVLYAYKAFRNVLKKVNEHVHLV